VSGARLAAIRVGGDATPWSALGFAIDDAGRVPFANGALEFTGSGSGLSGLVVAGVDDLPDDIEGIQLAAGDGATALDHPNGALEIDHVVVMTDSLERTSEAVEEALGLPCKRVRETDAVRQAFHRFADQDGARGCIIEVVENARVRSTGLFGLVVNVADLDAVVERWGSDLIGAPKPAVQPGRRIATVRVGAGLGVATALMTPGS
jgi:hypothetical protein